MMRHDDRRIGRINGQVAAAVDGEDRHRWERFAKGIGGDDRALPESGSGCAELNAGKGGRVLDEEAEALSASRGEGVFGEVKLRARVAISQQQDAGA